MFQVYDAIELPDKSILCGARGSLRLWIWYPKENKCTKLNIEVARNFLYFSVVDNDEFIIGGVETEYGPLSLYSINMIEKKLISRDLSCREKSPAALRNFIRLPKHQAIIACDRYGKVRIFNEGKSYCESLIYFGDSLNAQLSSKMIQPSDNIIILSLINGNLAILNVDAICDIIRERSYEDYHNHIVIVDSIATHLSRQITSLLKLPDGGIIASSMNGLYRYSFAALKPALKQEHRGEINVDSAVSKQRLA